MARRRRKQSGPARCKTCQAPIVWLLLRGKWRSFEPRPVERLPEVVRLQNPSYPIEGKIAWPLEDLVVELMGRRECTEAAAREEAHDFEWRTIHHCPDDFERKTAAAVQLEEERYR